MIVDQQQQYQNYLQHVDNSQNRGNDPESDDEGVISTSAKPNNASSTPHASKHGSANNNNSAPANNNSGTMGAQQKQPTATGSGSMQGIQGSSVAPSSYHMQQNLQISAQITKQIMDAVKKGDVNLVKQEQEKLGISIKYIMEENLKHNAIFQGTLIKDHAQAQKMVEYLISEGVDPCTSDSLSQTPLFYASREGNVNLVEIFVKNGCLPNHLDAYGQTSIFYAAREGHLEVCKKLAQLGADCDLVDHNGQTPIYYAVRGRKIDTVEFLIQQGADVNHEDKKQQTPMIIARRSNAQQIISLLIRNGAKTLEDLRQQSKQKKQAAVTQQQQPEVVIQQPTPQPPSNLAKKNPPAATSEKKQQKRYVLTVLKDGAWEPISNEEMDKFEQMYPEIAKFWKDPSSLEKLQLPKFPENAPIYESWDKAAKRLMNSIWKFNQSWIFHEPVDPERLGVPDYFNIIRNPMDFGTIKQRLNTNYYHRMQEFLDDMQLVFDNCLKFNGEENNIGKICKIVREEFKRLYEQLNIEFYLN